MGDNQFERELRAYLALQGASGAAGAAADWRNDLVAALRSVEPLSAEFREALAKAFEGDLHGYRLELIGKGRAKKARQDHVNKVMVRRHRLEFGEWIDGQIAAGVPAHLAIESASKLPGGLGQKSCEIALAYARRMRAWRSSLAPYSYPGLAGNDAALDELFHSRDAAGAPLDGDPNPSEME